MNIKKSLLIVMITLIIVIMAGFRIKTVSQDTIKTIPIFMDSVEYDNGQYIIEYSDGTIYNKITLNEDEINFNSKGNIVELRTETYEKHLYFFGHNIKTLDIEDVPIEPIYYISTDETAKAKA